MGGIPAAIASIITIPKLSINEGKIKISETLYSLIKSKDGKYKLFALVNEKPSNKKKYLVKFKLSIFVFSL